jgi:hypothetical protein
MEPVEIFADANQKKRVKEVFDSIESKMFDSKPRSCDLLYGAPPAPHDRPLLLSMEFMDQTLPKILKRLDAEKADINKAEEANRCKSTIGWSLLSYVSQQQRAEAQCPSTNPKCVSLRKRSAEFLRAFKSAFPSANPDRDSLLDAAEACVLHGYDPAPYVRELSTQLSDAMNCVNPQPGEAPELVEMSNGGMTPKYTLTRTMPESPASYQIGLNLHFDPPAKDAAMRAKVNDCLARTNKLLWQKNGEKMEIKLIDSPASLTQMVKLGNPKARVDSGFWKDQTDPKIANDDKGKPIDFCPTNTHEMLHLLGLCDEYKETEMGYETDPGTGKSEFKDKMSCLGKKGQKCDVGYDCRIQGPENSIMNKQWLAFDRSEKNKEPLLFPAQWRILTHPGCKTYNATSYACMERAYRTTTAAGGSGCGDQPTPAACVAPSASDPLGWLKDPTGEIKW